MKETLVALGPLLKEQCSTPVRGVTSNPCTEGVSDHPPRTTPRGERSITGVPRSHHSPQQGWFPSTFVTPHPPNASDVTAVPPPSRSLQNLCGPTLEAGGSGSEEGSHLRFMD